MKDYYVYIFSDRRNGRLYVGVTNDLARRVWEHKNGITGGHTKRYGIHRLVYYEHTEEVVSAITREKQLKMMSRMQKIMLIEKMNPAWHDLYDDIR